MFNNLYKLGKLFAILSVVPVMITLAMFIWQLRSTTNHLLWSLNGTVTTIPTQVDNRLGQLQTGVLNKIDVVQTNLNDEVTKLATVADTRIGKIEDDSFETVTNLRTDLNTQLGRTNDSIATLTTAYADIPKVVGAQYQRDFEPYFNCQQNNLCITGEAADTLFAIRTASRDTSATMIGLKETMPKIEDHISSISGTFAHEIPIITTNIVGITTNVNQLTKPKWYDRIFGYALNGAILYRNLNPVTMVGSTASQIISSQR